MSPETKGAGRKLLARLAVIVIGLVVSLAVLDVVLRLTLPFSGLVRQTVDIQTPTTLYLKLDELRRFTGVKIVVLGDSLIFGRTMRDRGDKEWQGYTLSSQLERYLAPRFPNRPVMVSNLGMNGTLPTDLDELVRILLPVKPDLVVFDLTLRSFSRDFDADKSSQTREWLADFSINEAGSYATTVRQTGVGRIIRDFIVNQWYLYRIRDFMQAAIFDGEPVSFVAGLRNAIDNWFKTGDVQPEHNNLDDMVLLMQARSRYSNIDLNSDNPQRQALDRVLQRLTKAAQPALIFYATENPRILPQLLPAGTFRNPQNKLTEAISPALSPKLVYVGPLGTLAPENFIDHVHLNREGYRRLTEEIGARAEQMLGKP